MATAKKAKKAAKKAPKKAAKKAAKKAPAKKAAKKAAPAKKKAPAKKAAKKKAPAKKRTPNAAFMRAMTPSAALAAVIGDKAIPRTQYEVRLAADGQSVEWVEQTPAGQVIYRTSPETGMLRRAWIRFLSTLPIDWLL